MEKENKLYYYHNDINGAPLRLTDEAGNIVWNVHYDIFGKIDKLKINELHNPIIMQGQYEDEETGLYYNRYRYYDPNISAYVSQDPIRLRAGINLYSYPINSFGWCDPLGLSCKKSGNSKGITKENSKLSEVSKKAENYKLSDKQYDEHILERHGSNSKFSNKSKFNEDFDIRKSIDDTLKGNDTLIKPNTNGRSGYIFEKTYSEPIGINSKGNPINTIKVVTDENANVITAFPK